MIRIRTTTIVVVDRRVDVARREAPDDFAGGDAVRLAVDHDQDVGPFGGGLAHRLASVRRQSVTTTRTVFVMWGDRLPAVPARSAFGRRADLGVTETGPRKDGFVMFACVDVFVRSPHIRVDRPVDAVLDFRAIVSLATHPSDRRVAEVVRVRRLIDTARSGGLPELLSDTLGGERAVVVAIGVEIPGRTVKERDVVTIRSGVHPPEVGPEGGPRVDYRIRADVRALETRRVRVRCVRRPVRSKVDVAHPERTEKRESTGRVRQEFYQGDVAKVVRAVAQCANIGRSEHIVGRYRVLRRRHQFDVVGPRQIGVDIPVGHPEELTDSELVVSDGPVGESGRVADPVRRGVAKVEHERVERVLVEVDERGIETARVRSQVLQVLGEGRCRHASVESLEKAFHVRSITLVELSESVYLSLQCVTEPLEILQVAHSNSLDARIINLGCGKITFSGGSRCQSCARDGCTREKYPIFDASAPESIGPVYPGAGVDTGGGVA